MLLHQRCFYFNCNYFIITVKYLRHTFIFSKSSGLQKLIFIFSSARKYSPFEDFLLFPLVILQFLQTINFLLFKWCFHFPCIVDVSPAFPFNQILDLCLFCFRIKISIWISILFYIVYCCFTTGSWTWLRNKNIIVLWFYSTFCFQNYMQMHSRYQNVWDKLKISLFH